jgi:hypothetical protein
MKKLLFGLAASLFLLSALPSCEKGNDTPAKTRTELLTQQSWKFSSASAGGTDVSAMVDDCYKDNVLTFTAASSGAGDGNVNEGANICAPSTAGTFTWTFQSGETELQVSATFFPGGSGNFEIVSLSETTLVLAQDMTIPPFPTTNVRVTLVH